MVTHMSNKKTTPLKDAPSALTDTFTIDILDEEGNRIDILSERFKAAQFSEGYVGIATFMGRTGNISARFTCDKKGLLFVKLKELSNKKFTIKITQLDGKTPAYVETYTNVEIGSRNWERQKMPSVMEILVDLSYEESTVTAL